MVSIESCPYHIAKKFYIYAKESYGPTGRVETCSCLFQMPPASENAFWGHIRWKTALECFSWILQQVLFSSIGAKLFGTGVFAILSEGYRKYRKGLTGHFDELSSKKETNNFLVYVTTLFFRQELSNSCNKNAIHTFSISLQFVYKALPPPLPVGFTSMRVESRLLEQLSASLHSLSIFLVEVVFICAKLYGQNTFLFKFLEHSL